jgi:hypothetical protein
MISHTITPGTLHSNTHLREVDMRITAILVFTAAIAAAVLTGCGSSSTGPSGPVDYFPLAIGNTWNFSIDGYLIQAGSADTILLEGTLQRAIVDTTQHQQGFEVWVLKDIVAITFIQGDTTITMRDTSFAYTFETSNEVLAYDDTVSTDHEIVSKLPVTVGETWEPYSYDSTTVREVLSVTASVPTPAGNFTGCAHFRDTDSAYPEENFEFWLAPGVGFCKIIIHEVDSTEVHYDGELESYVVN